MKEYRITKEELKEIFEGSGDIDQISTVTELKDYFNRKSTKGLWLKDVMEAAGLPSAQIPLEKAEKIRWIVEHVEVEGIKEVPEPKEEAEEEPEEEPAFPEKEPENKEEEEEEPPHISRENINDFIQSIRPECFRIEREAIDVVDPVIYEGMGVGYQDDFCVRCQEDYYENLVVLLKGTENVAAASGRLIRGKGEYHMILEPEDIDYEAFAGNRRYRVGLFAKQAGKVFQKGELKKSDAIEFNGVITTVTCMVDFRPMEVSNNALCIDFGTSNTSAGSYGILNPDGNDIELVSFTDVTDPQMAKVKLYPTMVYVENCKDAGNIRYLFGYEAKKKVTDMMYDTEASVFFEIKRWIGSLDVTEELVDEYGDTAQVKRRDIVKAYILHIIDLSQQYFKRKFKRVHLSAPVKLKEKFYSEMSSMLDLGEDKGYRVLAPESSVDEGIAIIYNSISRLVDQNKIREDKKTSIMILDCGGGTTDLASCEVSARDLDTGKKLEIKTKFVNGNSNFGGNNITFRIMQLLKIKLAEKHNPEHMENCSLKELIPLEESQILSEVEEAYEEERSQAYNSDTRNVIYDKFMEAYSRAEDVIPTVFTGNSRFRYSRELRQIKRNYYYLWQLAEKIKIKFYEEDLVSVEFRTEDSKLLEFDRPENYYLYIVQGDTLVKKETPADEVAITINEIRKVLLGDIYGLLNQLLAHMGSDTYEFYRLAGQSCKINLFMELLKEFIPGRSLRMSSATRKMAKEEDLTGSIRLKLDCIRGSIAYIRDKECGKIKPEMETGKPKLIYDVFINKVDKKKNILSKDDPGLAGFETFSSKATKAEFLVKNSFGETERKITVNFDSKEPETIQLSEMFKEIKRKGIADDKALDTLQSEIMHIDPKESDERDYVRIVFAIPSKEGYGMNIYRIIKSVNGDKEKYGWWEPRYENYENESTKSFFDGRR